MTLKTPHDRAQAFLNARGLSIEELQRQLGEMDLEHRLCLLSLLTAHLQLIDPVRLEQLLVVAVTPVLPTPTEGDRS